MKHIILISLMLFIGIAAQPQKFTYTYDANGNRIKRESEGTELFGKIFYDNTSSTILPNTAVHLKSGGNTLSSVNTNTNGSYRFFNIDEGQYNLEFTSNTAWGGVDPGDALMINRHYIGLYDFPDKLREKAADVSNDGLINPLDALFVSRRYIEIIDAFPAGDWIYGIYQDNDIDMSNEISLDDNSSLVTKNIKAICVGDVNGSYLNDNYENNSNTNMNIANNFNINSTTSLRNYQMNNRFNNNYSNSSLDSGLITIVSIDSVAKKPGEEVILHLNVTNFNNISAFGFRIKYIDSVLTFMNISFLNPNVNIAPYNNIGDSVNIAWSSGSENSVNIGDTVLLELKFHYNGGSTSLSFLPASMVADDNLEYLDITFKNGFIYPATPPTITIQPENVTKCINDSLSFSVTATGTAPLLYQWYKIVNSEELIVNAATNSQFTIHNSQLNDVGDYKCVVSNISDTITSDTVALIVNIPPVITQQPLGDTVCYGTQHVLTATIIGSFPFTHKWFKDGSYVSSDSLYDVSNNSGGNYQYIVSNTCGSDTSQTIEIHSAYTVPSIYSEDLGTYGNYNGYSYRVIKCDSSELVFTIGVSASGNVPLSYQWYKNDTLLIQGANDSLLTFSNLSLADSGFYKCIVSNVCGSSTSSTSHLIMRSNPIIITQPLADTLCIEETKTFSVLAAGTGILTYQWKKDNENITDATDSNYLISSVTIDDAGVYTCIVSDDCRLTLSDTARLVVDEPQNTSFSFEFIDNEAIYWVSITLSNLPNTPFWFNGTSGYSGPESQASAFVNNINNFYSQYFTAVDCGNGILYIRPVALCDVTYTVSCNGCNYTNNPSPPPCSFNSSRLMSGIIKQDTATSVKLYPNPNDGSFNLDVTLPFDQNVIIETFNILGEKVLSVNNFLKEGVNKLNLTINNAISGMYFIQIKTNNELFNRKILIKYILND